jgi:flavin reductase
MSWLDQRPDDSTGGAFTVDVPELVPTVDAATYREAMSRLGAAVHLVTSDGAAGRAGFTATAVCSVTDTPPTVLVCVNRGIRSSPILSRNRAFCVNTLAADGDALADLFAGRTGASMEQRFAAATWVTLATGAPVLTSAVVALDCKLIELKSVGSHNVLFGAVVAVRTGGGGPALVYHEREYKQI